MKRIVLLLILFVLFIPTIVFASSVETGMFKYMPAFENETEERYYYSDDYFKNSGTHFNEHLMSMSINLSLSTFEIRDCTYSKALLKDLGFKKFLAYDMKNKPTLNTIGMVMAYKKVGNKNVVAVALRGEKYDSEWGNNFIVGKEGDAKGFSDASNIVISRIKDFIEINNLDNVQLWITGYSRAGAIADLVGVYVNNNLDSFNTTYDDLFIYTFESPKASSSSRVFNNIYNVVSNGDLVPKVYPDSWGFHNNGRIIELDNDSKINTYYGLEVVNQYNEEDVSNYLEELITWLSSRLDRNRYSEYVEEPISHLLDIYFSKNSEEREKLLNFIMKDVKGELIDNQETFNVLKPTVWGLLGHPSDYLYQKITNIIVNSMNNVRNTSNGLVLTNEEYEMLTSSILPLLKGLAPILIDDASFYFGIDYDDYYHRVAGDFSLTDEEMGKKYGESNGADYGYDAGFEGEEKHEYDYDLNEDEYGPIYNEAYKNSYVSKYLEYYELGSLHRSNLSLKGEYDAMKEAYNTGYENGSKGDECAPHNDYLYHQDWMTDEYFESYDRVYAEEYLKGYQYGLENPKEEEEYHEELSFYHLRTLISNYETILKNHFPQNNLGLVHNMDSYYNSYVIEEGDKQSVDLSTNGDDISFKCNGDISKLVRVLVDNLECNESMCEVISGSTIVKLKKDFLDTLSVGTHTLKLEYIDDTVEATFNVVRDDNNTRDSVTKKLNNKKVVNPNTSDNTYNYIVLLIISIIGLGIIFKKYKRYL